MSRDHNDDVSLLRPEGKVDKEQSFPHRTAALCAALLRQAVGGKKRNINWQHKEKSDGQFSFHRLNDVKMVRGKKGTTQQEIRLIADQYKLREIHQ